ncbi:Gly-Xaa carboxypeptidase NDAI_0B00280 [Naumovozyma dairenensis CBS 421]|uniref:Peptidase M20 dimerisation domain-containing protein n=1 Tax=Naumovozyma dairenensis (strain ATCC 10597 / BCRC 20456 / CBS 421 / NBRC 0211 / NRRL Y-12639) TaxID=1071378 RepID=G0W5K1_NAUDC|nr:hypothetical protein NDAI_0B00280 [Naumovozyma dairenensis CBS 421]CCD23062.1 hypothetical protein NDAI_0B00280 [Naumovozyma dairenensis CBS 421]
MIGLPTDEGGSRFARSRSFIVRNKKALLYTLAVILTLGTILLVWGVTAHHNPHDKEPRCRATEPIQPSFNRSIYTILNDPTFKNASIHRLSGAVKIPTVVQDINPSPEDDPSYYHHFNQFHRYLKLTFPLVHAQLKLEKINKFGLLYTWQGRNETKKPLLLMSHQDVVPVNEQSLDDWEYPPFSGHYDPETDFIWGRGSNDCKNLLIAELEAVEQLLLDGFVPDRTVLLSMGFDEEANGLHGAKSLAQFLHKRYGNDSIYSIIDEGEGVVEVDDGLYIASPVATEKGYVDVEFTVVGKGGHSSIPPDHTTIGIASKLISLIEDSPYPFEFKNDNPVYGSLVCAAEHSKSMSKKDRKVILQATKNKKKGKLLSKFLESMKPLRDLIRSTSAVDIIHGGVKANALPEDTTFLVNHRIDLHSSVNKTVEKDLKLAREIAEEYDYGLYLDDECIVPETDLGYIELKPLRPLEPAPMSPTDGPVWDLLAGTIQNVFENGVFATKTHKLNHDDNDDDDDHEDKKLFITTGLFSGNTDTKYYWTLSENIYRFVASIIDDDLAKTLHSVNEHVDMPGHLSAISFIYQYITNVNEYA